MTNKDLFRAIGMVDQKYIYEAAPGKVPTKHHFAWKRFALAAACFFLVICLLPLTNFLQRMADEDKKLNDVPSEPRKECDSPSDPTDSSDDEEIGTKDDPCDPDIPENPDFPCDPTEPYIFPGIDLEADCIKVGEFAKTENFCVDYCLLENGKIVFILDILTEKPWAITIYGNDSMYIYSDRDEEKTSLLTPVSTWVTSAEKPKKEDLMIEGVSIPNFLTVYVDGVKTDTLPQKAGCYEIIVDFNAVTAAWDEVIPILFVGDIALSVIK